MKNLKGKGLLTILLVLALFVSSASMVFADLQSFLVQAEDGRYYEYNSGELNNSYLQFQMDPTNPAADMYEQFLLIGGATRVVALGDSVKGWMDFAAAQNASLAAQIAGVPFVINDFFATPAAPVYAGTVTDPIVVKPDGTTADLEAYNAALADVATKVEADYTADSWANLQTVLAANVMTSANTQVEIDAAVGAINGAIEALVEVPAVDLAAYDAAVAAANAKVEADYTADSWTNLQTVLAANVMTVANTQVEIDAAVAAINTAVAGLVEVADMAAYDAAVAQAEAVVEADYTAATYAALQTALTDNVVTNQDSQADVDAATAAINGAYDALELITKVSDVTATGAKILTVTFNQALTADQQKAAVITVKKGLVTTNLASTVFAEDGKSAVLTTASKLTKGTYAATAVVEGVTSTDSVDVLDEKVATIALTSDSAVQDATIKSKAKVFYEVKNQYGEVMTGQTINWSISTGVAATNDNNKSEFVITNAGTPAADFIPGATVYITGVHAASGTVMNAAVTIGLPAKADTVDFLGVYNTATQKVEALPAGFATGKYLLLYEAFDQYGHKVVPAAGQIIFTADNPLFINSTLNAGAAVLINGQTYQSLALAPGTNSEIGGTANINAISTVTGTTSSYAITADSLSIVKTFTMSAPADMIAVGEKVEIPFEAYDQNGVAVTKYDQLKNKITLNSPALTTLSFEKNADGTAKLVFESQTSYVAAITSITSFVTNQGSFSALNLDVKAQAVPTVITGLDPGVSTTVAKGKTLDLFVEDFIIQDQYGRIMTDAKVATASPKIGYKITDMSGTQAATPATTTPIALKATTTKTAISVSNGSGVQTVSSLEFAIYTTSIANENVVVGSQKAFPVTVATQGDYTSYEIGDTGMFYYDTDASAGDTKPIKVYGVKADGSKVELPQSNFAVRTVTSEKGIKSVSTGTPITSWTVEADNYDVADFKDAAGNPKTVATKITVDINDTTATGTIKATVTKDVTVSNAAKTGTTVTMKDKEFGGKYNISVGTTAISALTAKAITEVKDQYGETITVTSATISNVTRATGSAFAVVGSDIVGAVVGDTFTANFTYGTTVYTADFLVNATDSANTEQLNINAAEIAVTALEATPNQANLTAAQTAVNLLTAGTTKDDFNTRVAAAVTVTTDSVATANDILKAVNSEATATVELKNAAGIVVANDITDTTYKVTYLWTATPGGTGVVALTNSTTQTATVKVTTTLSETSVATSVAITQNGATINEAATMDVTDIP